MRILLAAKADVHASDAHDNDALTFAAGLGCGAVAVLLGVDAISIKNNPNNGTEEQVLALPGPPGDGAVVPEDPGGWWWRLARNPRLRCPALRPPVLEELHDIALKLITSQINDIDLVTEALSTPRIGRVARSLLEALADAGEKAVVHAATVACLLEQDLEASVEELVVRALKGMGKASYHATACFEKLMTTPNWMGGPEIRALEALARQGVAPVKRILKATSRGNCPAAPVQLPLDPGISHTQLEPHLGLMNKVSKKSILHPTIKLLREKALGQLWARSPRASRNSAWTCKEEACSLAKY